MVDSWHNLAMRKNKELFKNIWLNFFVNLYHFLNFGKVLDIFKQLFL